MTNDAVPFVSETWQEFAAQASEDIPCLIEGLWPEGALAFIASPPKKGKTWISLSLALSLTLGMPYLDRFPVRRRCNVIYVALEGHRAGLRARIAALARGMGVDPDTDDLERLRIIYKPRDINISEPKWAQYLLRTALEHEAELIVVDVLRNATVMKENDAEAFSKLRANLAPLTDSGVSVALLHHFIKLSETSTKREPMERMSGSGAMGGGMDVGIYVTGSEDSARTLRIEFDIRDLATPDMHGVTLQGDGTGVNGGFTHRDKAWWVESEAAAEDDLEHPAEELAQWIKMQGQEVNKHHIAAGCDCSVRTVERRAPRMEKLGIEVIRKAGKSTIYRTAIINPQVELDVRHGGCDKGVRHEPLSRVNPPVQAKTPTTRHNPRHDPLSHPENGLVEPIPGVRQVRLPTGETPYPVGVASPGPSGTVDEAGFDIEHWEAV